jgi:arylsulfatase
MARQDVRFEQFYSTSSVCSPSRASLVTGRYATPVGVRDVLPADATTGLSLSKTTIAEMLNPAGYKSLAVANWHLGQLPQYLPTSRGFGEYYGIPYHHDMSPSVRMHNTDVIESPVELDTLTQRYTQQAVNFSQRSKGPLFPLPGTHLPSYSAGHLHRVPGANPVSASTAMWSRTLTGAWVRSCTP